MLTVRYLLSKLVRVLETIVFVVALLSTVAGAALFGLGVSVLQDLSPNGGNALMMFSRIYGSAKLPSLENSAIFLLIGGLVIIAYGVMSMVAVCKKTYKYLCIFIVLMVLCIVFEASAGVYIVKFQREIDVVFRKFLMWTIVERYRGLWDVADVYSIAWDVAQMKQRCCGVSNGSDWEAAESWNRTVLADRSDGTKLLVTLRVPYTCCKLLDRDSLEIDWLSSLALARLVVVGTPVLFDQPCLHEPNERNSYAAVGCYDQLYGYVLKYNSAILLAATVVILAEVVAVAIVICLYKIAGRAAALPPDEWTTSARDVTLKRYAYQRDDTAVLTTRL